MHGKGNTCAEQMSVKTEEKVYLNKVYWDTVQRRSKHSSVIHPTVHSCPSLSQVSLLLGTSKSSTLDNIISMFRNCFCIYRLKSTFANTHSHAILVSGIKVSPFKEVSFAEQLLRTSSETFSMQNSTTICGRPGMYGYISKMLLG